MDRRIFTLRAAALFGGLAVIIGAFGAHGLKARIPAELLDVYEVGVRYHFYHALALLALAVGGAGLWQSRWTTAAARAWMAGILLFSGSLYLLALTGIRWLGAITPIGGVAFVIGWACLFIAAMTLRE